jgi:hypothetical protein
MAYPNPLGGARELNVSFELEEDQPVTLALYTETGEVIEELQMGILKAGKHEHSFDLGKLKAHGDTGLLYYKLTTPKKTDIHRIIFGK